VSETFAYLTLTIAAGYKDVVEFERGWRREEWQVD